jgi:tight adherence protein C
MALLMAVSLVLIGFSFAGGMFLLFLLFRQKEKLHNEEWFDRPPWLFRVTRPLIRLFAHQTRERMMARRPEQYEWIQDRLACAGLGYAVQPEEWVVTRWILLCFGLLFAAFLLIQTEGTLSTFIALGSLPLAYFYPDLFIRDRIARRARLIEKEFPFFLELLVLTLRAGLNFHSALSETVSRMGDGPVREEFERVLREVRTGKSRREALLDLGKRQAIPAIQMFIATINQAEETGGEMGSMLSVQAEERRFERFNRAETKANQAPVKMLLPLLGGMFPITFLLIAFLVLVKLRESGSLNLLF